MLRCAAFMSSIEHNDPVNARILAISEDKIQGFVREPFAEIAERSGVALETVIERIRVMLAAGTIRRVRQTLVATNLAHGALVAWKLPEEKLTEAFDTMFREDPFSGHVVIRSTDGNTAGSEYRLWTTVKAPAGFSIEEHCGLLAGRVGAERFRVMPARGIFALGVGHVRRKTIEPGEKADAPAQMLATGVVELSDLEWQVLLALKREFAVDEITPAPWVRRAGEAGVPLETFCEVAESLNARKVIGRFSTFLEHVKPVGHRRARHPLQRAVSLGDPCRARDSRGRRGGPAPHTHPLLLARGRAGISQRKYHGRGARDRKGVAARSQAGDRPAPRGVRNPGDLHECILGRAQRDQAVGDFADGV